MLGAEQAYDGMYGQGPPSIHSSHGGRIYQPQGRTFLFNSLKNLALIITNPYTIKYSNKIKN